MRYAKLTSREIDVMELLCQGKLQKQIADVLKIGRKSVDIHVRMAKAKLGADTTPQAVMLYDRLRRGAKS